MDFTIYNSLMAFINILTHCVCLKVLFVIVIYLFIFNFIYIYIYDYQTAWLKTFLFQNDRISTLGFSFLFDIMKSPFFLDGSINVCHIFKLNQGYYLLSINKGFEIFESYYPIPPQFSNFPKLLIYYICKGHIFM